MTAGLIVGAILWLAMVGVSCYGWLSLPADAAVPDHFGPASYNVFVPKRVGLIIHPGVGALLYAILLAARFAGHAKSGSHAPGPIILPLVMCVLLVVQAGAIQVARRRSSF